MSIFISHIEAEAPIAKVLKEWIESTFLGQWDVFVSSDSDDIPAGKKWLHEVSSALDDTDLMIVICSPVSIKKPWINFEAGCAWIKEVAIIPVCHSGLTKGNLPVPLSIFQGLDLESDNFGKELFSSLAKHKAITKIPQIDYNKFNREISAIVDKIEYKEDDKIAKLNNAQVSKSESKQKVEILEIEISILIKMAEYENKNEYVTSKKLAEITGINVTKTQHYIDRLVALKYLFPRPSPYSSKTYGFTTEGRAFLVDNKLI